MAISGEMKYDNLIISQTKNIKDLLLFSWQKERNHLRKLKEKDLMMAANFHCNLQNTEIEVKVIAIF